MEDVITKGTGVILSGPAFFIVYRNCANECANEDLTPFRFDREHRHQSLDRRTPDQVYAGDSGWPLAA